MSETQIGFAGLAVLFVLLAMRIPVAFAMFAVGFAGIWLLNGLSAATSLLASEAFTMASSPELVIIPLFILMGNIAHQTGLNRQLYDAAYAMIGHFRGGLAAATLVGCGGFAALSGSSVASALTMGKVSLGEMKRFGYSDSLSTGSVAAGGTLGILIPPSTGFVVYAILTEQSIGRLFLAGILPGLLLLGLFVCATVIVCSINPALGPAGPRATWGHRARVAAGALPMIAIVLLTIGGIYFGLFSPVEASAVGVAAVLIYGVILRRISASQLWKSAIDSVRTSATVMLILIAAHLVNPFLALSHITDIIGGFVLGFDLPVLGVLCLMLVVYLVLGCFLEGFAMMVLTLPIFFPIALELGIDPIWFGVLVVLTLEMGLISPPVGLNVFIVKSVVPQVPIGQIFIGVTPYWIAMLLCLALLVLVPQLALLLPNTMFGS